jgi:hypothetical protein
MSSQDDQMFDYYQRCLDYYRRQLDDVLRENNALLTLKSKH